MKKMLQLCLLLLCSLAFAQVNTQITPYQSCDTDNDQAAAFDLTTKIPEILANVNAADYTVTFWEPGNFEITDPTNYIANGPLGLVQAKVINNITQQLTTINLTLYVITVPNYQPQAMHACDNTGSGTSSFNLSNQAQYFSNPLNTGGPVYGSVTTTFFTSLGNAEMNINPISDWSYTNTIPFQQTIYARVAIQSCFKIVPVTLTVNTCTQAGNPQNMIACADISGAACFDLTSNTPVILDGNDPSAYTVTYHETLIGAEANTTPITVANSYCVNAASVVYARLTHNASGEYDIVTLTLTPSQIIIDTANPVATLSACDDNTDLSVIFDLSAFTTDGATLYTSQETAVAGTNPIVNASAYMVGVTSPITNIFIRIPQGTSCATIKRAALNVFPDCDSAYQCPNAHSLCGSLGDPFPNTTNIATAPAGTYGCLGNSPNPSWFYLPVGVGGNLSYNISQVSVNGNGIDVDYICYGPFNSLAEGCNNLTQANMVACSYSPAPVENFTIPNAQAGQYYLLMVTNYSNQAGFITINETAQNQGALSCSGLRMQAFLDTNSNGVKDAGENGFALGNFNYEANNNGTIHTITDADGFYSLYDENLANNYDISFNIHPQYTNYYNVTIPSYTNVDVQPGNLVQTYYFPVTVTQAYNDLAVHVIGNTAPRPGFTYKNTVVYTNLGTTPVATGTVTFIKDAAVSITYVSQTGVTNTATGFDYTFTNLLPFETRTITVTIQVPVIPTVTLGQLVESSASIAPLTGDVNTTNNTSVSAQEVIGSYDPNDKMESRGERILITEFGNNDYLYYTIRFQNTGTAPAEIVRIQDILDSQLDQNTVEMIRASHNYSLDRVNNILTWTFNNIMLPASNVNEPASHGYVYFRVKPRPGFQVGDIIPNGASIFFDFNPAIVTNTVNSEFVAAMSVDEANKASFTMYPNPANGTVNLQLANTGDSIKSVRVFDLTGKTILINKKAGDTYKMLDVSGFSAGAYMVEVITESNFRTVKKLMVK